MELRARLIFVVAASLGAAALIYVFARPLGEVIRVSLSLGGALVVGGGLALWVHRGVMRTLESFRRRAEHIATNVGGDDDDSERGLAGLGRALDEMADEFQRTLASRLKNKARLNVVLDAMSEGVMVTDDKGVVILTNPALIELAGEEIEGRSVIEVIRSAELQDAVRGALQGGDEAEVEIETRVKGEARSLTAQVAPLRFSGGAVAVIHDVTRLKLANKIRRDFVANASHELRTPLTAIRGFAETLKDGAVSDPQSADKFLDIILNNTKRMQHLIDDLTALSKAEAGETSLEIVELDVGASAAAMLEGLAKRARELGVTVRPEGLEGLPKVRSNEQAVEQIVVNLIENAIKYTPEGGEVWVRGEASEDAVKLLVQDTGPGIPAKHLERIFERFYRVDKGRARQVGGTGLGLSIVKHLCNRIGAEVGVESVVGEGTTFDVRFPLEASKVTANAAE